MHYESTAKRSRIDTVTCHHLYRLTLRSIDNAKSPTSYSVPTDFNPAMFIKSSILSVFLLLYGLGPGVASPPPRPAQTHIPTFNRAGVNITLFNDTSCGYSPVSVSIDFNLSYDHMQPVPFIVRSYSLSRFLSSEEQLDWSTPYPSDSIPYGGTIPKECGTYLQTTSPDSNNHTLRDGTCYLMTGGARVCLLFRRRDHRP